MKICHVCGKEYEDNAEVCSVCGAVLKTEQELLAEKETDVLENPVLLASFEDIVSQEIFKDILKDNGILFTDDSALDDGSMQVVFGGNLVVGKIFVSSKDFDKANELFTEFLESETDFEDFFEENETDGED
ncbi:MAG: hypothetical protein E7560_05575 [Ruminococcaceae bacterium]|nr:hypothetical protein [Oscillospiraceae bacterium]